MAEITRVLAGLQPGQDYVVQIRSKSLAGDVSEWSNAYKLSTPSTAITTSNVIVNQLISGSGQIIITDTYTGSITLNRYGILAQAPSGSTTFNIDSTTGNAFFSGEIDSSSGNIGGWTITNGMLYSGSGSNYVGLSSRTDYSASSYAIWAGDEDPAAAPFSIKDDGSVNIENPDFVGSASISGSVIATQDWVQAQGYGSVAGLSHTFEQQTDSTTWTINHNMGYRPSIICQRYDKVTIEGEIDYVDENNITLTFSDAVSGYAYLS